MNLDTVEEIYEALESCSKKYNESNKRLTFKCVERAKTLNNRDLEFDARFEHLQQLVFLSYDQEAIPMFPWFLKYCDENPDFAKNFKTLWAYKWIMKAVDEFANIPKSRIQALTDDFETRLKEYNATDRLLTHYRMLLASNMGEVQKSGQFLREYEESSDECYLDDCEACMLNSCLHVLVINGEYQEAIDKAKPILDKELTCSTVPKTTYSILLEASIALKKWDLAEKFVQAGHKALNPKEPVFDDYLSILWMLAIQKRFIKGRNIVQAQLNQVGPNTSNHKRMVFYHGCDMLFSAMVKDGKKQVKMDLDLFRKTETHFITPAENSQYELEGLVQWFEAEWRKQAKLLDDRNENTYYTDNLTKRRKEIEILCVAKV